MEIKFENEKIEVTCIGDSTIDNKIWVDGLATSYLKSRLGIMRDESSTRVEKYHNSFFKPDLSVVENLMAIMPNHIIHDYTNDGFTTKDVLEGNRKDKVFPVGAFLSFPHERFEPLVASVEDVKKSKFVILSIGGNNFREFLMQANQIAEQYRRNYIKDAIGDIFAGICKDYVEIVKKIRNINSDAKIILMTQYYPSASQNTYKIYEFMHEIGEILNVGGPSHDPMAVIHEMMKKTYTDAFQQLAKENIDNIVVADITSSINPYDKENHVSQIEPSGVGGRKIAMMLKHIMTDSSIKTGYAYRFLPEFFGTVNENKKEKSVITTQIAQWIPLHPYVLKEGSNVQVSEADFFLLQHLHNLNFKDKGKFSTALFKLLNTKDRFEILIDRIKAVAENYSVSNSSEQKINYLRSCISFIKNKGFIAIYTMETPGFQTPFQTALDRLEKLLEVMPEDDQANFLTEIYARYQNYLKNEKSFSENECSIMAQANSKLC